MRRLVGTIAVGKTLEQYLEQLRIAVQLRERESTALAKYLARFD